MNELDANTQVSHEQDGRVLTGVGVSAESLETTMERHAREPQTPGGTAPIEPGAETGTPSAAPSTEPPVTRGRQRFSDLTKERDSAKAETVAERTKREGLEREIAELRAQMQRPQTPQQAQQTQQQLQQAQQQQQAAQRFTFPAYEQFAEQNPTASYDDWQDAKDDARYQWRKANDPDLNVDARVSRSIAAQHDSRTFQERIAQTRTKARETYKDFDTVLASGPGASIPLGRVELYPGETEPPAMARARYIIAHPASEHLQYAILKDGDLARSLAQMSDIDFGIRLAQLTPAPQAQAQARFQPTTPYTPVGSGSVTTPVPSGELAGKGYDMDKSGYRAKRAAERGVKPRY